MLRYPDEILCDFAESYGIYNLRALPLRYAATLAWGLRADTRVKTALSGTKASRETLMLARLIDDVAFIAWTRTKAAEKNQGRPKSLLAQLLSDETDNGNVCRFETAEDFETARARILEGSE